MYRVISAFTDLRDNEHLYQAGDTYPREGTSPSAERVAELMGSYNLRGEPLIEKVEAEKNGKSRRTSPRCKAVSSSNLDG